MTSFLIIVASVDISPESRKNKHPFFSRMFRFFGPGKPPVLLSNFDDLLCGCHTIEVEKTFSALPMYFFNNSPIGLHSLLSYDFVFAIRFDTPPTHPTFLLLTPLGFVVS